jgi:NAD(P)-dependent dehydrogenase (short-subunit alcohol dehydrogenase family)
MAAGSDWISGKTVLVTGATSGIGLETARALAGKGARLVVGGRNALRAGEIVQEISRNGGEARFLEMDHLSFASIRNAAGSWKGKSLDVLVNNAGIAARERRLTADGHEFAWQTNFLSHFLLTRLLLPSLRAAAAPRVVNVSSEAHRSGAMNWDDLELERGYRGFKAYANTKLAQVLYTRELARREPGVAVNALHPGAIATGIWRATPPLAQRILSLLLPAPEKGARPVVRVASDPALEGVTGRYFNKMKEASPSSAASSDENAERLWKIAEESVGPIS